MEKFIPAAGYILVETLDDRPQGLKLPDKKDSRKAKVISVGKDTVGVYNGEPHVAPCKVGDVILHEYQYEGDVELNKKKYKVVKFESVLGVYEL